MRRTYPTIADPRFTWTAFLVAVGVTLTGLFTLLDPEPSRGLETLTRLVFWTFHVGVPLVLLQGAQGVVIRWRIARRMLPWVQVAIAGIVGSAAFAPVALWFDTLFALSDDDGTIAAPFAALAAEFAALAPPVCLVWLALNAARLLRLPPVAAVPKPQFDTPAVPEVLTRLPCALGRDIVSMQAELHYLRVVTRTGDALILYPFGQAVADLAPTGLGVQIHRSHWVALSEVAGLERDGARTLCRLTTGARLPVGRSRRAEVAARLAA